LRHPRQYVHLIKFSQGAAVSPTEKLDSLERIRKPVDEFLEHFRIEGDDKYLANLRDFMREDDHHQSRIYRILKAVEDISGHNARQRDRYAELKAKRDEHLSSSVMGKTLSSSSLKEKAAALAVEVCKHGIDQLLQKRQEEALQEITETLEKFGIIGFLTEYRLLIEEHSSTLRESKHKGLWPRGPVSLRRSMDKDNEEGFFEKIHRYIYQKKWPRLYFLAAKNQQSSAKRSDYIRYLIFAVIAADAGKWLTVRRYCKKALESENEKRNEALYLYAVALRHSCQDYADYQEAKARLAECRAVWEQRFPGRYDPRFDSETLSQAAAYFNYERFYPDWNNPDPASKPDFMQAWQALGDLKKTICAIESSGQEPWSICHRIKRQIYSNQCCLFLFASYVYTGADYSITEQDGQAVYDSLVRLMGEKPTKDSKFVFRPSYFINFLVKFLAWHFQKDSKNSREAWQEALGKASSALAAREIPYEYDKYSYFIGLLSDYGARHGWASA
jgi:hypothetical protein